MPFFNIRSARYVSQMRQDLLGVYACIGYGDAVVPKSIVHHDAPFAKYRASSCLSGVVWITTVVSSLQRV
jgi:hypothetical protein